jgi:hypothetical protein
LRETQREAPLWKEEAEKGKGYAKWRKSDLCRKINVPSFTASGRMCSTACEHLFQQEELDPAAVIIFFQAVSYIERKACKEMDVIQLYGLPVWILLALVFVILGLWLTARRAFAPHPPEIVSKKRLPAPRSMRALSLPALPHGRQRTSTFCPACGKQDDTPGARYCWFCGQALFNTARKKRLAHAPRWTTGTRLVNTTGQ